MLLRNELKTHERGTTHGVMLMQSRYESFREMTTLLALEVALVNHYYLAPSQCVQRVLSCIKSNDFYDCIKSQKKKSCNGSRRTNSENNAAEIYLPWSDTSDGLNKEHLSLEEDLLLYPSTGIIQGKPEDSKCVSFYDGTGIALLAYWKLWAQASATPNSEISPL
jgi:hypothetical protein